MSGRHKMKDEWHCQTQEMRVLHRLLAQLIIIGCLISSAASSSLMSKPNCNDTCGNVTIPYPFGFGNQDCYLNPYFEITCNGSQPTPFLRKFNLEVLNIDVESNIYLVKSPVYSTCRDGSSWESVDLQGSPFRFFSGNIFVSVGCENALMVDRRNEALAGCSSTCTSSSSISKGCYGINCCQTTIASSLEFYRLASSVNTSACTYAFLAYETWFKRKFSSNMFTSDQRTDYIPIYLTWGIKRSEIPGGLFGRDMSYTCFLADTNELYRCQCWNPVYEGNAYILNGCQAVAECRKCSETCRRNINGTLHCIPNRKAETILVGTVGGAVALVILITLGFGMYKMIKRRRDLKQKMKFFKRNGGILLQQQLCANEDSFETTKIFTVKELVKATDNFNVSRILGHGGQGTVYKGMLKDGTIIAVKKSTLIEESQVEQFINEVVILSQINHRNIVKLQGCCLETEVPLLVYEFISNGTLSQLIRNQEDQLPLTWEMRLQIATEVSGALAYLHSAASVPIYHRDIKSSNILLDDKYKAKVADFGTSRSVDMDQTHLTTIVQGTFGYLDPEFFRSGQFTDKSDVYSFGVVLVELLTGERPIMSREGLDEKSLATYFISALEENFLFDIIDERVSREGSKDNVNALALLARRCLKLNGRQRPAMREVMYEIERIRTSQLPKVNNSNKFHQVQSISRSSKKLEDNLSSTSFADHTRSLSDDSYPLMFSEENK